GVEIISQSEAGVNIEPDETGKTFAENAEIKAKTVHELTGGTVIADDSGLCVEALGGRPGIYSARYAPNDEKCRKLLGEMENFPENQRSAFFECCIALVGEDGKTHFMTGRCHGTIGYEERGTNGFGYDPVFVYEGVSIAEMTAEEKNRISHRGKAFEKLYEYLKDRNGE
ncbi:MAG: RdgB/HAM1 family non-canonical purine NTP pyrophosphatase, partial [Ruminococcus sp.]|nr:RdgB/HAM1 family non-canonical purine NTP pyrophosphatase [Ruminococcus sp.]